MRSTRNKQSKGHHRRSGGARHPSRSSVIGLGHSRRRRRRHGKRFSKVSFRTKIVNPAVEVFTKSMGDVDATLRAAKSALRRVGGKDRVRIPRVIPLPKTGGFLIPLLAGLSALGSLAGGAASIAHAVNKAKTARKQLEEAIKHDRTMEAIALGKSNGVHFNQYGKTGGLGLFFQSDKSSKRLIKKKNVSFFSFSTK